MDLQLNGKRALVTGATAGIGRSDDPMFSVIGELELSGPQGVAIAPQASPSSSVAAPLAHDTAAEIAQPEPKDWILGEVEAIPGRSMPGLKVVRRDYANLLRRFCALGPLVRSGGLGAHGTHYKVEDVYEDRKSVV